MADEAEVTHLTSLAEGLGAFEIDIVKIPVVDDVAAAEHRPETLQEPVLAEFILVQAFQRLEVVVFLRVLGVPDVFPALARSVLEPEGDDFPHKRKEERKAGELLIGLRRKRLFMTRLRGLYSFFITLQIYE